MSVSNPEFFDSLKNQIIALLEKEIKALSTRIALILERESRQVIDEKAHATGALGKSNSSEIEQIAMGYLIKVFVGARSKEGYPYGFAVHDGTKPHFPPVRAIHDWILQKGLVTKATVRGKNNLSSFGNVNVRQIRGYGKLRSKKSIDTMMDDYRKVNSLAFLIARSISKKGTQGVKFFEIALKQAMPKIEQELQNHNFKLA
jgi:hypothetical protein